MSWVFQNPHGVAGRTALDHVALPFLAAGLSRKDANERAQQLLERFGLALLAQRAFRELSGGEAQRLMLARGMAARPQVLLVDEPTAQLDRVTSAAVNAAIAATAHSDVVVVVATHDEETREACTDEIALDHFQSRTYESD